MKERIFNSVFLFLLVLITGCSHVKDVPTINEQTYQRYKSYAVENIVRKVKKDKPKNIILLIGDGMSLSTVYTAWSANHGHLNLENCEYVGLSKTNSANRLITDSGAGATAIAIGHKTNNGSVGVDKDANPQKSILEIARDNNLSTGLIATCNILDATPAAFATKVKDRDSWDEIALQYVKSEVDFVCGGGWENFKNGKNGLDLTKDLLEKGYQMPRSIIEMDNIKNGKVFAFLADNNLPFAYERGNMLQKAAVKGIDLLSKNEKGFFLMIEGSLIDDHGHNNDLSSLVDETIDFDRTIGEVLKWAANDGETLVIVTADHETGGLVLVGGDLASGKVRGIFATDGHSGTMVPVYSFGPKSEIFSGIFENTDLFTKMLQAYGFEN